MFGVRQNLFPLQPSESKRCWSVVTKRIFRLMPPCLRRSREVPCARGRLCDERWRHEPERSEEHTSELQSPDHLVCRLLLEKKKKYNITITKNLYMSQL